MKQFIVILCITVLPVSCLGAPPASPEFIDHRAHALAIADFILSLQNPAGAIEDARGSGSVNTDSNMEYALIGLAAAYDHSGERRFLDALERGIVWLAAREELADPDFRGSWRYSYAPDGSPLAVSPGPGYADARGVDTSSALFVYLIYLDCRVNPETDLAEKYRANAIAALEYLRDRSMDSDGCTWSSWLLSKQGDYSRWAYKYTADQADAVLGFEAGARLYDAPTWRPFARRLRERVESKFFSSRLGRYALGMEESGARDWEISSFDPLFCQGWLAWTWGDSSANAASVAWLSSKAQADGSLSCFPADPRFALEAACLCLGRTGLGKEAPGSSLDWLCSDAIYDQETGGVRDSLSSAVETCNVAGLSILALLEWPAFASVLASF